MYGICGQLNINKGVVQEETIRWMCRSMIYRDPDNRFGNQGDPDSCVEFVEF